MLTDLAFFLADRGHQVRVVTSRQRYDRPKAFLPSRESCHGVEVHRVLATRFGRGNLVGRALDYLSFYVSAAWRLFRLARYVDVVVAKTDPPLLSIVVAPIARVRGVPLVNWCQDLFPEVARVLGVRLVQGRIGTLLRSLRDASLHSAATNVALGRVMAERLTAEGVPEQKVTVIHNWSDGAAIGACRGRGDGLREEWGLGERFVVGYSGNFGRAHEFETVLDGAKVLAQVPEVVFLFVGGGPRLDWLRHEVDRLRLVNVRFQPYQPRELLGQSLCVPDLHLISLLPGLEGLIVPSKFYGILAAGRPAIHIGARNGEVGALLREQDCGLVVHPGRGRELADAILALKDDPQRLAAMGSRARCLLEARFDQPRAMAAWEAVLLDVAERRR